MIKRTAILITFILITTNIFAQNKVRIDLLPSKNKSVNIENIQSGKNGIRIKESISFIEFEEKETKEGTFIQLSTDGMTKSYDKGKPNLPLISRLIEIPLNSKAVIKVLSYEEEIIELKDYNLLKEIIPAQPSVSKSDDPKDVPFHKNQSIYKRNDFFKNDIVKFEDKGYLRNKHLGYIEISPFAYNPVTNTLKFFNNIDIEISFIPDSKAKIINAKNLESHYFKNITNTINQSTEAKALISGPVKYVIVSDPMFKETLQPFIEWKIKKGFNVVEAYTDDAEVGTTTASIKAYLQDLYNNPNDGVSPTFVLLVGDVAQIPAFDTQLSGDYHVTDLYYCEYTGDKLPDVFYGRFSAESVAELQPQIDKTLEIEKYEMPDPTYLDNVVLVAGVDAGAAPTYGNGFVNYANNYYTNTANSITSYFYLYDDASGVMASNNPDASASIKSYISAGVSLSNYTAHCGPSGWSDPSFSISDIDGLTNEHKYSLMIGNCCQSVKFEGSSFGEAIVRASGKGAVGYIGGSDYTYWDEDYYWGVGLASISANPTYESSGLGSYDRFFHLNEEAKEDWYITQGQINVAGNLAVEASTSDRKDYYWEIYHLMGDPSLTPYVTVPEVLTASYNSEIFKGSSSFQVTTEEDAYVAISKNGILLDAKLADATGLVELIFESLDSVGTLDLVITKQNRQPKIDEILIIPATTPYVVLDYYIIDDALENNNSEVDFGETIKLDIQLKNFSDTYDAFNVIANLISVDTNVILIDSVETFGTILKTDSSLLEASFTIEFKTKFSDQQKLSFDLEISGEDAESVEYTWNSKINLTVNAPKLEIGELFIDDSSGNDNGIFDPGETADILLIVSNNGSATISNLNGLATMLGGGETHLTLNNSETGNFNLNANETDTLRFNATANAATTVGTIVYLAFEIDDVSFNFYSKSLNKEIIIGEIPEILISDEGTVVTNNANFYDSGGSTNNYSNSENYTITISSEDTGKFLKAEFLSFSVEPNSSGCYDYLEIYDGDNTSSTLIGSFCDSNAPSTIVATNENRSLTFRFISDGSVTQNGWEAEIRSFVGYDYQVTVVDSEGLIEGAIVKFNGISDTTGIDGVAAFYNVPEGINYPLNISANKYDDFETCINLFEDTSKEITLFKTLYDITFNIFSSNGSRPIENAEINFLGQVVYSNKNGEYVFSNLEYSLNEMYNIIKTGYKELEGYVDINGNKNLTIKLDTISYDVTFVVTSGTSKISNVKVEFNSEEKFTDSEGQITFTKILPEEDLNFTLSKEGFWDYDSTLNVVDADVVFNARLSSTTGIIPIKESNIKIYPNPSSGIFNLEISDAENSAYTVKVFDIIGALVYTKAITGISNIREQIDISQNAKGMYFLSVESDNGNIISRRIIVK